MADPNPNYSEIMATTIDSRSKKCADNVTNNNALLKKLEMRGNIKTFSGGVKILQEMSYAENSNSGYYSGYDILPVGVSDVITTSEWDIKQAAVPVIISGLEMLQNSGRERMIDLMDARLTVAESTLSNLIASGIYSDGTGAGGKEIDGIDQIVSDTPSVGSTGGINPATAGNEFWRNIYATTAGADATTIQGGWNALWAQLVRGMDRPDLIMVDNATWAIYVASLQSLQRFTGTETGALGFPTIKYMDADVCLDGGIGMGTGGVPATTAYFLNTKFLHYRPHSDRNMVSLAPNRRYATNQDAEVQILAWAGNMTCSGRKFQGRWNGA